VLDVLHLAERDSIGEYLKHRTGRFLGVHVVIGEGIGDGPEKFICDAL
jgi:hypothetical protein